MIASVFGTKAAAFHLTNAFLHAINVALLFVFLTKATGRFWPAVFAAGLWGLHPLRVESVAWVSELKDVLCCTMWLLCMLAYLRYVRHRTFKQYFLVLVLMVLAMLAKPMAVTLPEALLLLDFWPLGLNPSVRGQSAAAWRNRILEKLPLVLLSAVDIAVGVAAQMKVGWGWFLPHFPLWLRIENAFISIGWYLASTFFPARLGLIHPHAAMIKDGHISVITAALAMMLVLGISVGICLRWRSKPYLFFGWFWFLGTLLPVLGLIQSGEQARADRFTYIPTIGLSVAVVWLVSDWTAATLVKRRIAAIAGFTAGIVLSVITFGDIGYWRNTETLFNRGEQVIPQNYFAKSLLATKCMDHDKTDEALRLTAEAVAISPDNPFVLEVRGLALTSASQFQPALVVLAKAVRIDPKDPGVWRALAALRSFQARQCLLDHKPGEMAFRAQAVKCWQMAVSLDPDDIEGWDHLADQTARMGKLPDAIAIWQKLVIMSPQYTSAQGHLADALRLTGDLPGAVEHYAAALVDGSTDPYWETNLAYLMATNPQATPAQIQPLIPIAGKACDQTDHKDPGPLDALAVCLARLGRFDDAIAMSQQAIDQANRLQKPAIAKQIQGRVSYYQRGLPWVAGDK
jgi:tetratricopeptide (TPR) repeat protein